MSASVPDERCRLGIEAMEHGKDYFADKPPLITEEQLSLAREAVKLHQPGNMQSTTVERRHVEAAVYAQKLLEEKAIGDIICINGFGPHRLSLPTRPDWFFDKKRYGGILVDIGCHQIEQMLVYAGAKDAVIEKSRTGNLKHKEYPGFEDFGDMMLTCDNGVAAYGRLDWFTPDGLGAWGDGRTIIVGSDGYIEIRKYIDVANDKEGDHLYLVNHEGERHIRAQGKSASPSLDSSSATASTARTMPMTRKPNSNAIELAIRAQTMANVIG